MSIGFDLDKIFINTPPFIPSKIIDLFYRGKVNNELKYRIPSKAEQLIRVISHYPLFRPPITKNLGYAKSLALANKNKRYLISGRFGFLKKRTESLIKRYGLNKIFNDMYFNYSNNQPHEFKNTMIKKLNLDMYVDDDLPLLRFLAKGNPKTKFYWLNNNKKKTISKNLFAIRELSGMFK